MVSAGRHRHLAVKAADWFGKKTEKDYGKDKPTATEGVHDAMGKVIGSNPDLRIPIGFAGGLHDRDLGFVRFGWRDYDTFTSRWTAPDPIGDAGGDPDWYGYCLDDPVNAYDPTGLLAFLLSFVAWVIRSHNK